MPVSYILRQFGNKIGLDPAVTGDRATLLRFLNEAADELWVEADLVGSLWEQVFRVNGGQTITMPMEVGSVRAVREFYSQNPIHLTQMRPRYNMFNWKDGWYNFRLKNTQALMRTITNSAPLTYNVASLDNPPITINVLGRTSTASSTVESVEMSSLTVPGTLNFIDIVAVTKSDPSSSDVTILDADGNVMTIIPNNALEAKYQILDISAAPWLPTTISTIDNYVEMLYKKRLPYLNLDTDEFPAPGYDNQLVDKCCELYYQENQNPAAALAFDQKATRGLARKYEEQNRATEDQVSFQQVDYDTIQPRIRGARFTRWTGWRRR